MKRMLIVNIVFLFVAVPLVFGAEIATFDARKPTLPNFMGYAPSRIVVKFDPSLLPGMKKALFSQGRTDLPVPDELGMRHGSIRIRPQFPGARKRTLKGRVIDLSGWHEITFSKKVDVDALVMAYKSLPGVIDAQPISIQPVYATPNDQFYDMQWHLSKIHTPEAWDVEAGNPEIIVAVPDTGVRYFMKDLGGSDASYDAPTAVNGNMWINLAERNGQPGVDDDGNGFIDDWIGWDFVEDANAAAPGFPCFPGEDCGEPDNDPRDFNGHGTHCACSIAAINHNSEAICSPSGGWGNGTLEPTGNGVKVMPLRIGWSVIYFGFEVGGVDMSYAAQALQYAADHGAKIVSCSWASDNTGGIQDAIDYFLAAGGLIFKAAGNDGADNPDFISSLGGAGYDGIINVAATDSDDCLAWFSNYGSWVDVSAPGVDIWSCFHDHYDPVQDYVTTMDGTSMAAPLAASVAALIWSQDPALSAAQVKDKLLSSADYIDHLSCNLPYAGQLGAGRVNAYNAVSTSPLPLPDLAETSLTNPPPAVLRGGSFSVTDTAINQGTVSAGASTTRYYLSTDTTKNSGDMVLTGTRSVPALEPGAVSTGTVTVTVSTTTAFGTYYLLACADDTALVAESNEANNCLASAAQVEVTAPDLMETSVSDPPALVAIGGSFSVTDTVINQGPVSAKASTTRYYLSTDTTKSSGDKLVTGTRSVPALEPGAVSTGTVTVTVPTTTAFGTYYLLACADGPALVAESNEANNCLASAAQVQVTAPDLMETSVSDPPALVAIGGSFSVTDTVINQGPVSAKASTTRYYLSTDTTKNSGDKVLTKTRSVPVLEPGAVSTGTVTVTVPTNTAFGTYYLLACADDTGLVVESNEANNCIASAAQVEVTAPDLMETSVSDPPALVAIGGSFSVTDTVINQGPVSAKASTTRYYLSTDTTKNSGDKVLTKTRSVPVLEPGAVSTGTVTVTIPTTTAAGTYYLLACADDTALVAESNEANNCIASGSVVEITP